MPTTPAGEIGHDDVVDEVQLWLVENPPAPRAVASTLEGTPEVPPSPELARACRSAGRGVTINSPSRISATLWSGTWQRSSYVARRRVAVGPLMSEA